MTRLSKRDFDKEELEEEKRLSILEEIKLRNKQHIDPKINPENFTESDYYRNHYISSEG